MLQRNRTQLPLFTNFCGRALFMSTDEEVYWQCALTLCYRGSKRKTDVEDNMATSVELSSASGVYKLRRDSVVSVVLAGGIVELYSGPVSAALVMEKHPGLCLARPEVFSHPHRAVVSPRERLFPGHKFYLVPHSTVKKLMRNATNKSKTLRKEGKVEKAMPVVVGREGGGGSPEGSASMAKGFFVSKANWTESFVKRFEQEEEQQQQKQKAEEEEQQQKQKEKAIVKRPRRKPGTHHGLLLGWKPKLPTIKEQWSP